MSLKWDRSQFKRSGHSSIWWDVARDTEQVISLNLVFTQSTLLTLLTFLCYPFPHYIQSSSSSTDSLLHTIVFQLDLVRNCREVGTFDRPCLWRGPSLSVSSELCSCPYTLWHVLWLCEWAHVWIMRRWGSCYCPGKSCNERCPTSHWWLLWS